MNIKEATQRAAQLREIIEGHNHRYYVLNQPVISDFEYDLLLQELIGIERKFPQLQQSDSPTRRVGSDLTESSVHVNHN
jgi:DNA ligase (NAD+)